MPVACIESELWLILNAAKCFNYTDYEWKIRSLHLHSFLTLINDFNCNVIDRSIALEMIVRFFWLQIKQIK